MIHKNYKSYSVCIYLIGLVFFAGAGFVSADSLVINENISATANSGGNVIDGSGNIQTGDTKAESKVETNVSGSNEAKVNVKTEAEANGKKVETGVHEQNSNEDINIQKKVEEDGGKAQTTIDISARGSDPSGSLGDEELENESSTNIAQSADEEKNILVRVAESLSSVAKNMLERIFQFLDS
jgi:hypothetical protein